VLLVQVRSQLLGEAHRRFDLDPPNRHALNVDPERNTDRAAVGHQLGGRGERLLVRGFERIGGVGEAEPVS